MLRPLHILAGIALSATLSSANADPSKTDIDAEIQRAMETFNVPGMAVAVVHDGSVAYAGGLGAREVGADMQVDGDTLFQIGSVSKAFTSAALAILADEGKLDWDDRVIDHLPEFRMYDAWVTREFTIRDLLTHRSGLPLGAGDLLLFPEADTSREEIVHAMRYLKPATSFRSKFAYDNLLYVVAGVVVERVSGQPFEDFVEQRLLSPLGMKDCKASLERVGPRASRATPHMLVDGELRVTSSGITATSSPAGGINCSARSMAHWMRFMLDRGVTSEGQQLISEKQFDELLNPVTPLPVQPYLAGHAGTFMNAYALGWNVSTFYGQPEYSHGGGVLGMTTFLMLLPDQDLGIFASGNQMSVAPRAVVNDIADEFLAGVAPEAGQDWIATLNEIISGRRAKGAEAVAEAAASRATESTPSLPLEAYAGTFRDDWYGDIQISLEDDGRLWFRSGRSEPLQGPLEHFQYDTFIARWTDRKLHADAYVSFTLTPEGEPDRIRMKAVSPNTDFSFDFHDLNLRRVP
ncbi:MAG: serine hydrolase [Lysobacterales bacterium]|jgi:CubicO group peptidase (beta-lactamase class C family)